MTAFDPEKITFFAKTDARGQGVSFGIKAKDRQRHMYIVGKTGMGKSTLLENMAAQDIMNGEGVAFIDPHGSAAETLLDYVPEHRVKDVVYFAPFDLENPISFNVMEDVGPDKRHLVVSGLMSTFKKIWVDAWSARMEYILTNALLVLIEYPDSTLLSVNRLFSDKAYRKKVVEACQDPAVKSFWVDEFANYTDRFTADALPAIQNKIGQFTGNPLIRNIIGQPHSSFDFRELMDNKKIVIMNLSKGLIGETNANLLGSMLTTRIYLAAMSRADLPVEQMKQMPNFYFYVDEFQSFANATFANILSEARKYHLNLIIAHQYIAQMEEEVRDAVFGNVGTTVAFRVGPFDAEVLETVFTPKFLAADLVNLGFAQIYLTLMIDGIGSQPFSAQTLPPVQPPSVSCRNMVIESSRKLYAGRREEVNKLVDELHTPQPPEPKQNSKKSFDNKGGDRRPHNNYDGARSQGQNDTRPSSERQRQGGNQPKESTPRPKPVEKTPEDLRNILSKISEPNQNKKVPVADYSKPVERNPNPNSDTNNRQNENSENKNRPKFEERGLKTEGKNYQKQSDRLVRNDGERTFPGRREKQEFKPRPQNESPKEADVPAKTVDLKQALADVLKQVEESNPPVSESASKSAPTTGAVNESPKESQLPANQPVKPVEVLTQQTQEISDSKSEIKKIIIEHRKKHPAPEIDSASNQQNSSSNSGTFNTAEIKRMLKQNESDRSPFN